MTSMITPLTRESVQPLVPPFSPIARAEGDDAIGGFLALAARADVISLAGGLPAPEGFPANDVAEATKWVLTHHAAEALQYSSAQGLLTWRQAIAQWETERGVPTGPENVLVVSGSQQALDLMGRAFCSPGDKLLVESPTYVGALEAFRLSGADCVSVPSDAEGLDPEALNTSHQGARFLYVMPTFQNPTGKTLSLERREALAQKARELDLWLLEDSPYQELYYDKAPPPSLRSFAPERTITLGSMSKVLSPGLRLGYILGPAHVIKALTRVKGAMDLHSSTFTQWVGTRLVSSGFMDKHLPRVRALYRHKADVLLAALESHREALQDATWTKPEGGMFIWMTLPDGMDATRLLERCLAAPQKVGFVPGTHFFADRGHANTVRLSFVTVSDDAINQAVETLVACYQQP